MIGQRIQYNKDMAGEIIDENDTHVLVQFDSGMKYCTTKIGNNISEFNKEIYEKAKN